MVDPSFVNPWSVHEVEHVEIDRRVAQVSDDVVSTVADGVARYVESKGGGYGGQSWPATPDTA